MANVKQELSKTVNVNEIPKSGIDVVIDATPADIMLVNKTRMPGGFKCNSLLLNIHLNFLSGDENILRLTGELKSNISTACSISSEPMELDIVDELEVDYSNKSNNLQQSDESFLLPEPIENGQIDIYEAGIQGMLLALPTNPTIKNAKLPNYGYTNSTENTINNETNPFEVLKSLKKED